MESNYNSVLEAIMAWEDEEMLEDFLQDFEEGEGLSKDEFMDFCYNYVDDINEVNFIKEDWKEINK